jgi:hypothetical protein
LSTYGSSYIWRIREKNFVEETAFIFFFKTTQLRKPGKLYSTTYSGSGCYDSESFIPYNFIRISEICIRKNSKDIQKDV